MNKTDKISITDLFKENKTIFLLAEKSSALNGFKDTLTKILNIKFELINGFGFKYKNLYLTSAVGHLVKINTKYYMESSNINDDYLLNGIINYNSSFDEINYITDETKIKKFNSILNILKGLDINNVVFINATDPEREGELIFTSTMICLLKKLNINNPYNKLLNNSYRLWSSSVGGEELEKAFNELFKIDDDTVNVKGLRLLESAFLRQIADFNIGLAVTHILNQKTKSFITGGRVQTPVLNMIFDRYNDNINGKTRYEGIPAILLKYREIEMVADLEKKEFGFYENYFKLLNLKNVSDFSSFNIEETEGYEKPKKLLNAMSLNNHLAKIFKMKVNDVMKNVVQKIYDDGLITYPRTEGESLVDGMQNDIKELMNNLFDIYNVNDENKNDFIDDKISLKLFIEQDKIKDSHHAIILTKKGVDFLKKNLNNTSKEVDTLKYISLSLFNAFGKQKYFKKLKLVGVKNKDKFEKTLTFYLNYGFLKDVISHFDEINIKEEDNDDDKKTKDKQLKEYTTAEIEEIKSSIYKSDILKCYEKKLEIKPLSIFTESTLISAMKFPKKYIVEKAIDNKIDVDGEEFKNYLKKIKDIGGIGTPATRDTGLIIETLYKREYVKNQKNKLIPTETGIKLINYLKENNVKNILGIITTAKFEKYINNGRLDIDNLKKFNKNVVSEVFNMKDKNLELKSENNLIEPFTDCIGCSSCNSNKSGKLYMTKIKAKTNITYDVIKCTNFKWNSQTKETTCNLLIFNSIGNNKTKFAENELKKLFKGEVLVKKVSIKAKTGKIYDFDKEVKFNKEKTLIEEVKEVK